MPNHKKYFSNLLFYKYLIYNPFIPVYKLNSLIYKDLPGDYCKGVTPDPIPNSEVKPFSANGTLS